VFFLLNTSLEKVIDGPLARWILLHQTFICGEKQNLQCIVIAPRTLSELKTAITAYIRNISQANLQKVFANKIKRVQACIDAHVHHFQHPLQVRIDFQNALHIINSLVFITEMECLQRGTD
jgi:hypothetical protein